LRFFKVTLTNSELFPFAKQMAISSTRRSGGKNARVSHRSSLQRRRKIRNEIFTGHIPEIFSVQSRVLAWLSQSTASRGGLVL
jgi:hypothetical protein